MKEFDYFKINTVEELNKAYYMFEDKWSFSLEDEIIDFNNGKRYVIYNPIGTYLGKYIPNTYTEIISPIKSINNLNKLI